MSDPIKIKNRDLAIIGIAIALAFFVAYKMGKELETERERLENENQTLKSQIEQFKQETPRDSLIKGVKAGIDIGIQWQQADNEDHGVMLNGEWIDGFGLAVKKQGGRL